MSSGAPSPGELPAAMIVRADSPADLLVAEVKDVIDGEEPARRTTILREVTDLFLVGAAHYTTEQVQVFDDVICTIIEHVDRDALMDLAKRLVPCAKAPSGVMCKLATNTDVKMSCYVLEQGTAFTDDDLAEVIETVTSVQQMVIAGRDGIGEAVTDALINRGDFEVMRRFVTNEHARVSHIGFVKLINAAKRDGSLTELVASRVDLPDELKPFIGMLRRSAETAQANAQVGAQAGAQPGAPVAAAAG